MEPAPDAPDEARVRQVRRIFSTITDRYDFLQSFPERRAEIAWRRFMVRRLRFFRTRRLLDLATGTGDVAIAAAQHHGPIQVVGLDFAGPMLEAARPKIVGTGAVGWNSIFSRAMLSKSLFPMKALMPSRWPSGIPQYAGSRPGFAGKYAGSWSPGRRPVYPGVHHPAGRFFPDPFLKFNVFVLVIQILNLTSTWPNRLGISLSG